MIGWWGSGGVRLKDDESTSLKVGEGVRMLVDGLAGV